jgi:hypothetical protein
MPFRTPKCLLRRGRELLGLHQMWFPGKPGHPVDTTPVRTQAQLSRLLAALAGAGRPLVVLIYDAQWLYPQSVDMSPATAGSLAGSAISVVYAHQTSTAAASVLDTLRARGSCMKCRCAGPRPTCCSRWLPPY